MFHFKALIAVCTAMVSTYAYSAYEQSRCSYNDILICKQEAERGVSYAQNMMGLLHSEGKGVFKSQELAFKWYLKAAEQGNSVAQFNVALAYHKGDGVKQNRSEAVKWFRKAAEAGDAKAQTNLGVMYLYGEGTVQDNIYAYKWFEIAAQNGYPGAVENKENLSKVIPGAEIEVAQQLAQEWLSRCR